MEWWLSVAGGVGGVLRPRAATVGDAQKSLTFAITLARAVAIRRKRIHLEIGASHRWLRGRRPDDLEYNLVSRGAPRSAVRNAAVGPGPAAAPGDERSRL